MRKTIFFIVFLLIAASTHTRMHAQSPLNAPKSRISSLGMRVYDGDLLLEKSEVKSLMLGTPAYDLYNKALRKKTTGFVLLGVGIGVTSYGAFSLMITGLLHTTGNADYGGPRDSYWRNGGGVVLGITLAGCGIMAGGVVLLRTCKHDVTRAVDAYNSSFGRPRGGELTLGFTPGGVGLAYRF